MKNRAKFLIGALLLTLLTAAAARTQDDKAKADARLSAIGGLGASTCYFTFVLVGVTADNFEKGIYDAEKVRALVKEVAAALQRNEEQLAGVKTSGLTEADARVVDELAAIAALILDYGARLVAYTGARDKAHAEEFQKARQQTWERLKKALGVK